MGWPLRDRPLLGPHQAGRSGFAYGPNPWVRPQTIAQFKAQTGLDLSTGGLWAFDEAAGNLVDKNGNIPGFLYKTAASGWDTGCARSVQTAAGDCYAWTVIPWNAVDAPGWGTMVGLSDSSGNVTLGNTDAAIYYYTSTGWLRFWQNGSETDNGTTAVPGDKIGVRRVGTTIEFLKNDVVVFTSGTANGNVLTATANTFNKDAQVQMTFEIAGVPTPITWQNVVGMTSSRDLLVEGAPTFGDVLNGGKGIKYTAIGQRHVAYQGAVAAAESCLVGAIVTVADAVNQSHVWGSFGAKYAMLYWSDANTLTWRLVSGATVAINIGVPTKDTRQYVVLGQLDRSSNTARGCYARQGLITKNSASSVGVGGLSGIFGANTYNNAAGQRVELGFIARGAQCEGADLIDTIAARLGFV